MKMHIEGVEAAKEYALIRTGMHSSYRGDCILNSETYAWRIGHDFPGDAEAFAQNLRDAETEYTTLTGVSPRGIQIMASCILKGMRAALREAKVDGRT